jgi:excisionase family DNA binding protein
MHRDMTGDTATRTSVAPLTGEPWLTIRAESIRTNANQATLRRAIRAGYLRACRLGTRGYRLRASWTDEWLMAGGRWR